MGDKIGTVDSLFTELLSPDQAVAPRNPCPKCGKETKEHHPEERTDDAGNVATVARRICSATSCRSVFDA